MVYGVTRPQWVKLWWLFTRGQFWPSGIVIACVCVCVYQSLAFPHDNSSSVQARITKFGPEKQNTLVKIPIFFFFFFFGGGGNWPWPSRSNLTSNSKLTPFWACPNHYSPPILVRISKFGQQMHFSTVKIPVNSGLDWPWTSPSFLIPKLIFTPQPLRAPGYCRIPSGWAGGRQGRQAPLALSRPHFFTDHFQI